MYELVSYCQKNRKVVEKDLDEGVINEEEEVGNGLDVTIMTWYHMHG